MNDFTKLIMAVIISFTLLAMTFMISLAWTSSPTDFKLRVETDNNTLELFNKSLEIQRANQPMEKIELYYNIDDPKTVYIRDNETFKELGWRKI